MKQITKFFTLAIVMIAFSGSTFAQVGATATASATIITPIAITKTVDMNFGNIAVGPLGGDAVLPPAGARTATGDVTFPAVAGTVAAASFDVTGEGASTYSILITPVSTILTSGPNTMTVGLFISTPLGTGALTAGAQTILVGARLIVGGAQAPGLYTTLAGDEFTVTVNYN